VAQLYPRALGSLSVASYDSQGLRWRYSNPPPHGVGLVVRVPGYITEMYRVSCEVRTEFIYVMQKKVDRLCGLVVRVPGYRSRDPGSIPGATRLSEK
jgi:hypothetical protein